MDQMITQVAKAEGVTEGLKATEQMEWVRQMNSIRNQAEEVVMVMELKRTVFSYQGPPSGIHASAAVLFYN